MGSDHKPMVTTGRASGARSVHLSGDDCKMAPNPGLIGRAKDVLDVLNYCHNSADGISSAILPPEPACISDKTDCPVSDLTTLLEMMLDSAKVLHRRLTEVNTALRG